ncbi:MAG TPA: response regulator transcription factor [Rubrobacter sp.]
MNQEIRVMIVDDHATFREPLAFMLEREPDLVVVAQSDSLSDARMALENGELVVDVAIVDLDLPDGPGTDFIRYLRDSRPRAAALVLSGVSDQRQLAGAIEAGASGIMHKSTRTEELVRAVRRLHAGGELLSQQEIIEALRLVVRERERDHEAQLAIKRLTPRELEVLQALAEGLSDREISQRLHVGIGTVHSHVTNILAKLGAASRLQALVFAVRHGLVAIS